MENIRIFGKVGIQEISQPNSANAPSNYGEFLSRKSPLQVFLQLHLLATGYPMR